MDEDNGQVFDENEMEDDLFDEVAGQPETQQEQTESDGGAEPEQQKEPKDSAVRDLFDWMDTLVSVSIVLVLIFTFLFRLVSVDGRSMQETLHDKDRIIISNLFYTPKTGDIVVITKPVDYAGLDPKRPFIKRVIATGGQTVDIDYAANTVAVDGVVLNEDYIHLGGEGGMRPPSYDSRQTARYEVPEGCIFVMGDNRNNSLDSRYLGLSYVDERYILGRLAVRVYPFNVFGSVS